jgi:hypothetical protein
MEVEETLRRNGPALGIPPALIRLLNKMVAFEPGQRYQTPTQLVEALLACRSDVAEGGAQARVPTGPKTLFVVESNQKLQDAFRDRFKTHGYRVLLSIDPAQAVKRYEQKAFHAIIIDARTVGRDGVAAYNGVLRAADNAGLEVGAILILGADQKHWKADARAHARGAVLIEPPVVSLKQLLRTLEQLTGVDGDSADGPMGG